MNKKILMLIPLVLLMTIAVAGVVPALAGDVNLAFDMDSGALSILNTGIDSSTWHTGSIGQSSAFTATGDVSGSYVGSEGNYGQLHTTINAQGAGVFTLAEYVDFNVVSANHIYDTEGFFTAGALGSFAEMNIDIHGSMYVWSEHDQGGSVLAGSDIYKDAWVTQSLVLQGEIAIRVTTDGQAQMWNSAAWGFGLYESGAVTADYSSATNYVSASGAGTYSQYVFGNDYAEMNGLVLGGGGSLTLTGGFTAGLSGTYTMEGN